MTQDLDKDLDLEVDGLTEDDSEANEDGDTQENNSDDKTSKNTSNFKRMAKAYKGANAKIKELEAKLAEKGKSEGVSDTDMRFYFIENPEAKEYKEEVLEVLSEFPNMDIDKALLLAKQLKPKESQDKQDFNLKADVSTGKKKLEDLTDEEALKLDNQTYAEWDRLKSGKPKDDIWG